MGFAEFLTSLFCGAIQRKLSDCSDTLDTVIVECDEAYERIDALTQDLLASAARCKVRTDLLNEEIDKLIIRVDEKDNALTLLREVVTNSLLIPDVAGYVSPRAETSPYLEPTYNQYELHFADLHYNTFTYEHWIDILDLVHIEVKKTLKFYQPNISDCDNYAEVTASLVSLAMRRAGLALQAAIMVIWSETHAYNAFEDIEGKIWLYEPQNDSIVGELHEGTESYDSRIIWFPNAPR